LRRLGRELTITLSSNLDGVADLRAADPLSVLALVERDAEPLTLERATRLATLLRATNLIHGSLVRAGEDVRVDLGLYRTGDREPVARVTATGAPERITALTDST
ncbi:MAG: hypothetical protein GWM90_20245, partial [Gemmatimonadetes bacterium]|nr:hypothetical protein [Gemmatimonadota bacterium]NIU79984.1 hypothetical protein [Gammaproteobacteria bacterium]NIV90806.1 hypothetical protein [Actinomycetota bacterium]NIQ59778.1 hypothetical protein [Gemmatimonadota bacterium]NIX25481.1 hypothetical protein [Actinomycetota bacterium]